MLEFFGLGENSRSVSLNGDKDVKVEEGDEVDVDREEAKLFRSVVARLNFLSLDCPDLRFPVKQCSREMGTPKRGSFKGLKKMARFLVGRKR